jgi:DNA-binding NarL/FixJ family response regulator
MNETKCAIAHLSSRQQEVLMLMAEGHTNREIAAELHLGEPTVKDHVGNILELFGAANRTQAVAKAIRTGVLA